MHLKSWMLGMAIALISLGEKISQLGYRVEEWGNNLFGWAYDGSDEEIDAVWYSEFPISAMSERQRQELATVDPESVRVECFECQWEGRLHLCMDGICPECDGNNVYTDFYPKQYRGTISRYVMNPASGMLELNGAA